MARDCYPQQASARPSPFAAKPNSAITDRVPSSIEFPHRPINSPHRSSSLIDQRVRSTTRQLIDIFSRLAHILSNSSSSSSGPFSGHSTELHSSSSNQLRIDQPLFISIAPNQLGLLAHLTYHIAIQSTAHFAALHAQSSWKNTNRALQLSHG